MACCNCKQLFLSGNKLYKHLKEECSQKAKAISKKAYPVTKLATRATTSASLHAPISTDAPTMPQDSRDAISIMKSTVPKSDLRFEYAFCNWNYAMVLAALKSKFRSYNKTLSKDQTNISPLIDVNWINAREAASSGCNDCINTRCDTTMIN